MWIRCRVAVCWCVCPYGWGCLVISVSLQICVQVLCILVSQKVLKVEGGEYDCVLRTFEVKCVNCWGSVSSIEASRVHWNGRVKDE